MLDRRQDFLRVRGPVDTLGRVKAAVAVAASAGPLAEIVEQCHPAAGRRLAIAQKRVEALVLSALALRPRVLLLDELPPHPDVGEAVEHVRLGGRAVAPGPADLLVVGLDAARQVGVEDVAHVRLVDPHAEGDGGDDDHAGIGHEDVLVRLPLLLLHPCVIGERPNAVGRQHGGGLLGLLAREAVDDAALALVAGDEAPQLTLPLALHLHRELDVGAVEAEHEVLRLAAEQLFGDVVAGHLVGRRRQRRDRDAGEERAQPAQILVFRAEGRAPLRDAVGFVDGEEFHRQAVERRQHALGHQPFRGHVEKPRLARRGAAPGRDIVGAAVRRVDAVRRDPGEPERGDLVLHERDQRRHHHREPVHDQRGNLEAERFARARRHHRERAAPGQQGFYRCFLAGPKILEPEDLPQHSACLQDWLSGRGHQLHRIAFAAPVVECPVRRSGRVNALLE